MTNEILIQKVDSKSQIERIEKLGNKIWKTHYTPIIGVAQVEYMLKKFQSVDAITAQIEEGYQYYLIASDSVEIGYFSVQERNNHLFLSKIYLKESNRGQGIFSFVLQFIEKMAIAFKLDKIMLTVNKYNHTSIEIYKHKQFIVVESAVFDIGSGYVMDDYVMMKQLIQIA